MALDAGLRISLSIIGGVNTLISPIEDQSTL